MIPLIGKKSLLWPNSLIWFSILWHLSFIIQIFSSTFIFFSFSFLVWSENQHIGWIMSRTYCNRIRNDQLNLQSIYINHKEIRRSKCLQSPRSHNMKIIWWIAKEKHRKTFLSLLLPLKISIIQVIVSCRIVRKVCVCASKCMLNFPPCKTNRGKKTPTWSWKEEMRDFSLFLLHSRHVLQKTRVNAK